MILRAWGEVVSMSTKNEVAKTIDESIAFQAAVSANIGLWQLDLEAQEVIISNTLYDLMGLARGRVITAHAMKGDKQDCLDNDMDDYMSKPLSLNELKICIDKWMADYEQALSA